MYKLLRNGCAGWTSKLTKAVARQLLKKGISIARPAKGHFSAVPDWPWCREIGTWLVAPALVVLSPKSHRGAFYAFVVRN
jgi:hypothetical protein